MQIHIVYPEHRTVSEDQIESWYADAKADGLIEGRHETVREKANALDDIGVITVGKFFP